MPSLVQSEIHTFSLQQNGGFVWFLGSPCSFSSSVKDGRHYTVGRCVSGKFVVLRALRKDCCGVL